MNKYEYMRRISYYTKDYFHCLMPDDFEMTEEEFIDDRDLLFGSMNAGLKKAKLKPLEINFLLDKDEIERRIKVIVQTKNLELKIPDRKYTDEEYLYILSKVLPKEDHIYRLSLRKTAILTLNLEGLN